MNDEKSLEWLKRAVLQCTFSWTMSIARAPEVAHACNNTHCLKLDIELAMTMMICKLEL